MRPAWHQRLLVRIGVFVLLTEAVALALMGWWYTGAFGREIDRERERRLALPGMMMAQSFLTFDAVGDRAMWREMLGDDVVEAMIFNTQGRVMYSLRAERLDEDALALIGMPAGQLAELPPGGRIFDVREGTEVFAQGLFPLQTGAGQPVLFHLFIKVRTMAAEARKREVARNFLTGSIATVLATTVVLVGLFATQVGRSLNRVVRAAEQVEGGDLQVRVPDTGGTGELAVLSRQVNRMLEAITERSRRLAEVTRFQQAILDHAAYAIIATDARGTITAFNRAAEQMLGYRAGEMIGHHSPGVFHDLAEVRERAAEFSTLLHERIEAGFDTFVCRTRHGLPNESEWTYVRKDGSRLTVMLGITALRDGAGRIEGYLGIAMDLALRRAGETELRRSRLQLEAAQRLARIGSFEFALATGTLTWSRQMYEIYARDHELGPPDTAEFFELLHPADRPVVEELNRRATTTSETLSCDFRSNPARGALKYLTAHVYCLRDAAHQPVAVAGTVQDITDRKCAELALAESEERNRLILDALLEGVTVHAPDGAIIMNNRSAERILGRDREQLQNLSRRREDWEAIREDGTPFPAADYPTRRTFQTGQPVTAVAMGLPAPSGGRIWISINTAPLVRAGTSQPYAVVASFFDVTEQRRAEQAAQERVTLSELEAAIGRHLGGSASLNEALAESLRQLVDTLDLAMGRVWMLTERDPRHLNLVAVHGFDPSMAGVYARVPVDGTLKICRVARERRNLFTNDLPADPTLPMTDWERREQVTAFAGYPLVADGRLLGVLAFFHRQPFSDELLRGFNRLAERLSLGILRRQGEEQIRQLNSQLEQRVAERTADLERRVHEVETLNRSMINLLEDLQQARDAAERTARQIEVANQRLRVANEELEAFSYSVSHDLRAPLRNVSGFVDLLRKRLEGGLEEGPARYMKIIQDEATRMGHLIDDLLEFSRLGRARLRGERFAMSDLVGEVRGALPAPPDVEWIVAPLPVCIGDRSLLRQVWVNLLGNALKYSRQRQPARIEVGVLPVDATAGEVVYFVRDNGVGFDMKYVDKLFGVFQRLHSAAEFEGTGIGLANVQRIIRRHGGRVWAEGQVGAGAAFYFALPVGGA